MTRLGMTRDEWRTACTLADALVERGGVPERPEGRSAAIEATRDLADADRDPHPLIQVRALEMAMDPVFRDLMGMTLDLEEATR